MPSVNNVITFEITVITKNYAYALHAGCRLEVKKKIVNMEFVDNELWWCCWVTFNAGASCCGLENSMERASYACSRDGCVLLGYFFSRLSLPLSGRRQDID